MNKNLPSYVEKQPIGIITIQTQYIQYGHNLYIYTLAVDRNEGGGRNKKIKTTLPLSHINTNKKNTIITIIKLIIF